MNELAIVTIVSNNYLHYARTLMQGIALHHPGAARYCVIVDTDHSHARALGSEFETITLEQLSLPDGDGFKFQYNVLELNTAVKPWAMEYLLKRGHAKVFYLDPDIQVHRPLSEVQTLLDQGAALVLTPHLLAPITDDKQPSELDIRRAGTYNLGFCALRSAPEALNYLHWWQGKLKNQCLIAFDRGIFVDQSWVDLAPGLFPNVAILRHPGYNLAYWNIAQRPVTRHGDQWLVCGEPLVFFHFSGLNPQNPHKFSKYQNRYTLDDLDEPARALVLGYCASVAANGLAHYHGLPYSFGFFANGAPISDLHRARFRNQAALRESCGGHPFSSPDCFTDAQAHQPTGADELAYTRGGNRLLRIYHELLGRAPEAAAVRNYAHRCESKFGSLRTLLTVGLSAEARAHAGWVRRLLALAANAQPTPVWARRWVLAPLLALGANRSAPNRSTVARPAQGAPSAAALAAAPSSWQHTKARAPARRLGAPALPVEQLQVPPGINLVGYLMAELGLGEAARSLARACAAVDIPFYIVDVGYQTANLQRDSSVLNLASPTRHQIDLFYVNADQTPATARKLQADRHSSRYTIGFWHWEQTELPTQWLGAFDHVDEVWVPSTFVHDVIAPLAPVPVVKIPHALQIECSPSAQRSQFGLPPDLLLVLVMYDFHSYQHRKNPQAAVAAFMQAARTRSHLGLVIKTINSQHHADAYQELRASVEGFPNIFFIDEFLTRQQTWDLQSCCDVLVSLHRAEGFGLALAEMMYLGKPVVGTAWSANMDFMTADNSFPVRYQLQPLANDVGVYRAGLMWAQADVEHAAWCLGQLADKPDLARHLGTQAALDIRAKLSPAAVGRQIRQRLQVLGHWYPELLAAQPVAMAETP